MSAMSLPIAWRGLNAGSYAPLPRLVCPQPRLSSRHLRECRFYQAGRLDGPKRPPSVQSRFAQLGCYLRWGDVIRLLRGHYSSVFARTGSSAAPVGLSPPSAFGLVWRVLAVCYQSLLPRQLPDVISNSLFLDAGSPTPAVHRVLSPVSSTMSSAFPRGKVGRLPAAIPLETTSCRGIFEVADISLCSGLQVCSPPRSSLPLRILPQGSRGFYVRAECGSLPPRASDMLTARRQAIGGTGTCTPLDCGLVGCSSPLSPLWLLIYPEKFRNNCRLKFAGHGLGPRTPSPRSKSCNRPCPQEPTRAGTGWFRCRHRGPRRRPGRRSVWHSRNMPCWQAIRS